MDTTEIFKEQTINVTGDDTNGYTYQHTNVQYGFVGPMVVSSTVYPTSLEALEHARISVHEHWKLAHFADNYGTTGTSMVDMLKGIKP